MKAPAKPSKYRNVITEIDGMRFDSRAEAKRWRDLKMLERGGVIANLERQIPIELVAGTKLHGANRARPAIRIVVDFRFYDVELSRVRHQDTKGEETAVSLIKRHIAKVLHGIDVEIV